MFDSAREATPASARVSHKRGKGVVAVEPKMARRRFLKLALSAVALGGAAKVASMVGKEDAGRGAKVTFIPKEAKAAEPEHVKSQVAEDKLLESAFGADKDAARVKVDEVKAEITSASDYKERIMAIPLKYEKYIRQQAEKNGINGNLLMGLAGVENGGGEAIYGDDGLALGLFQFWEGTARDNGLVVNQEVDERADPYKSIEAAAGMIKGLKGTLAGNEGLAIWTFNAGFGRVMRALQIYFNDTIHFNIGDYIAMVNKKDHKNAEKIQQDAARLIKENGVTVHKVLQNSAALDYLSGEMYEGFEKYPYRVVAIAELFQES